MSPSDTAHFSFLRNSRRTFLYLVLIILFFLIVYQLPSSNNKPLDIDPEEYTDDLVFPPLDDAKAVVHQPDTNSSRLPISPPSTKNGEHPPSSTSSDDEELIPINTSGHYAILVVIASPREAITRRQLIREHYFGLRDNMLPCMRHDTGVTYRFWVYGDETKLDRDGKRDYAAERMEWDDIVERNNEEFEQLNVVKWAVEDLEEDGITFGYLVLQDINTFIHLSTIAAELQDGTVGLGTDSSFTINEASPYELVWGTFSGTNMDKQAVIFGRDTAIQAIIDYARYSANQNTTHIFTQMYRYYTSQSDDEVREGPDFIREDGPDGAGRFTTWSNTIEPVRHEHVAVTSVFQNEEFRELAHWTNLRPVQVCHPRWSSSDSAVDDDDEPALNATAVDPEAVRGVVSVDPPLSVAVLTSSFVFSDLCMLSAAYPSAQNKRAYALRHGYSFVARSTEFSQQGIRGDRATVWGKVDVIEKMLPKYDWVLWMDMDAVVMNPEIKVEKLLEKFESIAGGKEDFKKKHLIVAKPRGDAMINAGVFLIRNSEWSRTFMRAVNKATAYYKERMAEQAAMWDLMRLKEWEAGALVLLNDDHTFNTFPTKYIQGDFVVHYAPATCPAPDVLRGLSIAARISAGEVVKSLVLFL
ncbi:galactosyl transferase GMA12/MNN10 family-domain-containing protein [Endogone sp. FLAS-F59071]|nr:galactosyl transferase GMA12/MNN10 family-domain-containing protein [Endogone sp. FLAS-F59071]|eukprot:RUS17692.1 galactosyl transferase GMA12/MNN10 family-domain-containing protein [Endogone sp. FLAS-F59071]